MGQVGRPGPSLERNVLEGQGCREEARPHGSPLHRLLAGLRRAGPTHGPRWRVLHVRGAPRPPEEGPRGGRQRRPPRHRLRCVPDPGPDPDPGPGPWLCWPNSPSLLCLRGRAGADLSWAGRRRRGRGTARHLPATQPRGAPAQSRPGPGREAPTSLLTPPNPEESHSGITVSPTSHSPEWPHRRCPGAPTELPAAL